MVEGRSLNSEYFGQYHVGSLPKITGGTGGCVGNVAPYGAFYQGGQYGTAGGGSGKFYQNVFDASRSSGSYWRTDNEVHANHLGIYYLIKY